jgi:hypothetical protein
MCQKFPDWCMTCCSDRTGSIHISITQGTIMPPSIFSCVDIVAYVHLELQDTHEFAHGTFVFFVLQKTSSLLLLYSDPNSIK